VSGTSRWQPNSPFLTRLLLSDAGLIPSHLTQLESLIQKPVAPDVYLHRRQRILRSRRDIEVLKALGEGAGRMSGGILRVYIKSTINWNHLIVVN
jgi:hypothetical protein